MILGYSRILKNKGNNINFQDQLFEEAKVEKVFQEDEPNNLFNRPVLRKMLEGLSNNDVVVVPRLDYLSYSLKDLLNIIVRIKDVGADLISISESLDTAIHTRVMSEQIIRTLADFENNIIYDKMNSTCSSNNKMRDYAEIISEMTLNYVQLCIEDFNKKNSSL